MNYDEMKNVNLSKITLGLIAGSVLLLLPVLSSLADGDAKPTEVDSAGGTLSVAKVVEERVVPEDGPKREVATYRDDNQGVEPAVSSEPESDAGLRNVAESEPAEDRLARFAEMDPLALYERMTEAKKNLQANRREAALARQRVEDYSNHIRALTADYPPRGQRSPKQENLLIELENLHSAANYLRRDRTRKVRELKRELAVIEEVMTVSELEGVDELLVRIDIPGRPTVTKQIPVEDELDMIFDKIKREADAERAAIWKSYKNYLKDTDDLRVTTLAEMKTNREKFMEDLDREYEVAVSARRTEGRSAVGLEPPPGYEDRKLENARQAPKAIPAQER